MRKTLALAALLPFALIGPRSARADEALVDGIAAQVGSDTVLLSEVLQLTAPAEKQLREFGASDADIARLRSDALDRLIERRLVDQVARRSELEVNDAELETTIANIARENGITVDQVRSSVEAQGLVWESYRETIRSEIQQAKLVSAAVTSRVRVEESEVRDLFQKRYAEQPLGGDEIHLRHILVTFGKDGARSKEEACGEVRKARARIAGGEPFEEVARRVTEVSPEVGGDLGWLHAGEIATWMDEAALSLSPGSTSDVIETSFGCNLIQLVERRSYEPKRFEDEKAALERELFDRRTAEKYAEWMERLRSQTYIERKDLVAGATSVGAPPPGKSD
jgi:peptidyl-prolyl cis-trans isomerase SurA